MSVKITIGGTVINFPTSGTDANWAEAVTEFALAVENQLLSVGLITDIAPQVTDIPEANSGSPKALFTVDGTQVRAFTMQYGSYRVSTGLGATSKTVSGVVNGVYNETTSSWTIEHEFIGDKQPNGEPYITFDMNQNTLEVTAFTIGGTYDTVNSTISYSAKTLPVSN
jgi:hypothetical protein